MLYFYVSLCPDLPWVACWCNDVCNITLSNSISKLELCACLLNVMTLIVDKFPAERC